MELLKNAGFDFEISTDYLGMDKKKLIKTLKKGNYEVLVSFLTDNIDKEVIDSFSGKLIANYAVGYNNVDVEYAKSKGIIVTNSPYESECVSEFAVSMILAIAKKIVEADQFIRDGKYKGWDPSIMVGEDIKGKTLGVIGTGRIGSVVVRIMSAGFGMKIIYNDIARNRVLEEKYGARQVSVDELFKEADVITIHTVLTKETHHLVSRERIYSMKKDAIIINTSRGPVVDEKALADALSEGVIAGAALDVFEYEPKVTKTLMKLQNVILTPHIASATVEARDGMSRALASNVVALLSGLGPVNKVN